jgi:hypothetical protein
MKTKQTQIFLILGSIAIIGGIAFGLKSRLPLNFGKGAPKEAKTVEKEYVSLIQLSQSKPKEAISKAMDLYEDKSSAPLLKQAAIDVIGRDQQPESLIILKKEILSQDEALANRAAIALFYVRSEPRKEVAIESVKALSEMTTKPMTLVHLLSGLIQNFPDDAQRSTWAKQMLSLTENPMTHWLALSRLQSLAPETPGLQALVEDSLKKIFGNAPKGKQASTPVTPLEGIPLVWTQQLLRSRPVQSYLNPWIPEIMKRVQDPVSRIHLVNWMKDACAPTRYKAYSEIFKQEVARANQAQSTTPSMSEVQNQIVDAVLSLQESNGKKLVEEWQKVVPAESPLKARIQTALTQWGKRSIAGQDSPARSCPNKG